MSAGRTWRGFRPLVKVKHRVGFSTTKIGLELHDWITALSGDALHCPHQHALEAFREVGTTKELHRVLSRTLSIRIATIYGHWIRPTEQALDTTAHSYM
jgi:hypothetical protein